MTVIGIRNNFSVVIGSKALGLIGTTIRPLTLSPDDGIINRVIVV